MVPATYTTCEICYTVDGEYDTRFDRWLCCQCWKMMAKGDE